MKNALSALLGISVFCFSVPGWTAELPGQAIGFYSDGRLVNAAALPTDGPGFFYLFPSRDRKWGTDGLVSLIERVSAELMNRYPDGERLQLGDLSAKGGGKISRHGSHQNGLDVDFVYLRVNRREQPQDVYSDVGFIENFAANGKLSKNFDVERNWALIRLLVEGGRINRIFVDPVIKKTFCSYAKKTGLFDEEVLRRVRPYVNHGDHLHLRLSCPVESAECVSQIEIPPGSGCDQIAINFKEFL